jgi:hypothetical protein
MPIHPNTHRCQHIKVDGIRCGSPAVTGEPHCYWHRNLSRRADKLSVPALEDANAIQVAINRIFHSLVEGRTDTRTGCAMLYALQLARDNMRNITVGVPRQFSGKDYVRAREAGQSAAYQAATNPKQVMDAYAILMGFDQESSEASSETSIAPSAEDPPTAA